MSDIDPADLDIRVIEDFISPEEIEVLINMVENKLDDFLVFTEDRDVMFTIGQDNFPEAYAFSEPSKAKTALTDYKDILLNLYRRLEDLAREDSKQDLNLAVSWIARRLDIEIPVHVDNEDNSIYRYERTYVVYLNSCSGDGGTIYFPDQGYRLAPRPGIVVSFPTDYRHGVTSTQEYRYSITNWFTLDKSYSIFDHL